VSLLAPLDRDGARALLAPSARLVVASVDPLAPAPDATAWAAVQPGTLLALAQHERCEAALLALAQRAPAGAVAPVLLDGLRARARVAAFRAAGLEEGAEAALDALAAVGVPALWLKGAGLALADGDDGFARRPMGDLDLLVEPSELSRAVAALTAAGWTAGSTARDYDGRHHHLAPMTWLGDPAVRLELHRAVWPPGHPFAEVAVSAWLAAGRPVLWRGRSALVPSAPWALAHAATHWAWSHEGVTGSWQWLRDLRALGTAELDTLGDVASGLGVRRPVGWAVRVAGLLGPLPASVAAAAVWSGRGRRGLGAVADRQWVVRAFAAGAPTPGVAWDRRWWRWSMGGLGDGAGAWPWAVGVDPLPPVPRGARAGLAVRWGRWRGWWRRVAAGG
jgi:hypothetical protein